MRCIQCGSQKDKVVDSRMSKDGTTIRRRRECLSCGYRYTTYEQIERTELRVVKKDGTREALNREKTLVARGVIRPPVNRVLTSKVLISRELVSKVLVSRIMGNRELGNRELGNRDLGSRELVSRKLDNRVLVREEQNNQLWGSKNPISPRQILIVPMSTGMAEPVRNWGFPVAAMPA